MTTYFQPDPVILVDSTGAPYSANTASRTGFGPVVSTASTNATSAVAAPVSVFEVSISNTSAATVYFKIYNKATAPTVGTDTPVVIIPVTASGTVVTTFGTKGKYLSAGLGWALTAAMAASDVAAVGTGVIVSGTYV